MQKPHLKILRLPGIRTNAQAGKASMDPQMWSALPEDVLERVLGRLPAASICRLRAVCRRWRSLLSNPGTLSRLAGCSTPCIPFICTFEEVGMDFQGGVVHSLDLSFLPLRYRKYWHTRFRFREAQDVFASHGGVVCITDGKKTPHAAGLCVFNPVTRAWRELPAMTGLAEETAAGQDWRWSLDIRTLEAGFEVTVLCRTENPPLVTTAVFSSQAWAWRVEHDQSGLLSFSSKACVLVCPGMYYRPAWHYLLLEEQKTAVLHRTFTGDTVGSPVPVKGGWLWDGEGTWDCVCVDASAGTGEFYLVSSKGGIWKLDQGTMVCSLVSSLPDELRGRVFDCGLHYKLARAVHMDGVLILVLSGHAARRCFGTDPCICQHYLVFSVANGTWHYAAFCKSCRPIVLGLINPSLASVG